MPGYIFEAVIFLVTASFVPTRELRVADPERRDEEVPSLYYLFPMRS